jgi:hypothetical protein
MIGLNVDQNIVEAPIQKLGLLFFSSKQSSILRIFFFRIINDFVHILDHSFVDFTITLLILPFDIVDFNSKMVKSTVKP